MEPQKTGNLINRLRTSKQMTQKQLAEKLNVSDKAVSKWERGDCCPDTSLIPKICELFSISMENFMEGKLDEQVKKNLTGKRILLYDFKRPDLFSRKEMSVIANAFDIASEKLSAAFSAIYPQQCRIHLTSVDQITNEDFIRFIPTQAFIYDYDFNNSGFIIQIDSSLGKKLLKQDSSKYPEINEFDTQVLYNYFAEKIEQEFQSAFYDKTDKSAATEQFMRRPSSISTNFINHAENTNQMCCLVTLECQTGDFTGSINIQFNEKYLRRTMRKLGFFNGSNTHVKTLKNIKQNDSFNTYVEFGRFAADEISFENDDLIILDRHYHEGVMLIHKDKLIGSGNAVCIGLNGEYSWGIQMQEISTQNVVYDEKDYIAVRLGSCNLSDEESSGIQKGKIIELNEMVGEYVTVIKNGKKAAHGEIEIHEENFAVRIVE